VNGVETPEVAPKRSHRRLWYVLAGIALSLVALAGSCAFLISRLNFGFDIGNLDLNFNATPGVYKPIPVSTSACPYLRRVHDTADRSGQLCVATTFGSLSEHKRGIVTVRLVEFDLALQRAMPHVPPEVQKQLHATLVQVRAGEQALKRAASLSAYGNATFAAALAGNTSLGNASDLVGHACGFRLEPVLDFSRLMQPTPTTTTPAP
jgi:hypothetical protein